MRPEDTPDYDKCNQEVEGAFIVYGGTIFLCILAGMVLVSWLHDPKNGSLWEWMKVVGGFWFYLLIILVAIKLILGGILAFIGSVIGGIFK